MARASGAALVLAVALFVCSPVSAARFSGDYILQVCGIDKDGKELSPGSHIACQAYLSGIIDYHAVMKSLGQYPGVDFCVPEGTGLNEIQNNVVAYIYRHKHEQGPFIAAPSVAIALSKAYPCKKKK